MKKTQEEDITDVIADLQKGMGITKFKKAGFKVGRVMTFNYEGSLTTLEITRIEDGKWFAKHVELHEPNTVASHYHHNVNTTEETVREYGSPYCSDCEVPVSQPATLEGKKTYETRKENYLPDGTYIGDEDEI